MKEYKVEFWDVGKGNITSSEYCDTKNEAVSIVHAYAKKHNDSSATCRIVNKGRVVMRYMAIRGYVIYF